MPFRSHCRLQAALGSRDRSGPNFPSSLKYPVYFGQVKEEHCQKLGLRQEACLRQHVLLHLFGSGNNVQFGECSENFAKVDVIFNELKTCRLSWLIRDEGVDSGIRGMDWSGFLLSLDTGYIHLYNSFSMTFLFLFYLDECVPECLFTWSCCESQGVRLQALPSVWQHHVWVDIGGYGRVSFSHLQCCSSLGLLLGSLCLIWMFLELNASYPDSIHCRFIAALTTSHRWGSGCVLWAWPAVTSWEVTKGIFCFFL